ncbi:hypothetical protein ACWDTP_10460 [Mycobacterium sp. NPDC003449]
MTMPLKFLAPWLAATAVGAAVAFAPVAAAATPPRVQPPAVSPTGTDPLVPYGTNPDLPYPQGYIDSDHDEVYTTNGGVDLPF